MRKTVLLVAILVVALAATALWAMREPPAPVTPVVHNGVKYTAPMESMGVVVALDAKSGAKLWQQKIYDVKIDPSLEADIQYVYITTLAVQGGDLIVTNEMGAKYAMNLSSRAVRKL